MKVKVYDSGKKFMFDRFTLYFPYPKWLREEDWNNHRRRVMGCFQPFSYGKDYITLCAWDYDDRTLGYNIPRNERKVKIEAFPKVVQDYAHKMEGLWNDALKYDDDEHWKLWNEA